MPSGASDASASIDPSASAIKSGVGRGEVLLLALGFAVLVAVGASSIWIAGRNAVFNEQLARTAELKSHILLTLSVAQNAETGQRGFLLTNDERYLTSYDKALADWQPRVKRLEELVGPDGPQHDSAMALTAALKVKMDELAETVALQRAGKTAEARAIVETERGRNAMLKIRSVVTDMRTAEEQIFASRTLEAERGAKLQLIVVVLGLLIAAALAWLSRTLMLRQTRTLAAARTLLAEANTGLEAAVVERTADLTRANEEIQRFAYIVSHDLRAPLVNVMGFTSELDAARRTLKDQIDSIAERDPAMVGQDARLAVDEDLPEAIGFIRTSTAKMDRLIGAILKLSREGRRNLALEPIDMTRLLQDIADGLRQQCESAGATIAVDPLPPLQGDRLAIDQVFGNLVENAVKYLDPARPGRIRVTGKTLGSFVEYVVEDNGRGIDKADLERVFDLFRRAGAQDRPGEGIGLAHVRALIRRLGGTIALTSTLGQGSRFVVTLPGQQKGTAGE